MQETQQRFLGPEKNLKNPLRVLNMYILYVPAQQQPPALGIFEKLENTIFYEQIRVRRGGTMIQTELGLKSAARIQVEIGKNL
jgi:hypothetical protein